MGKTMTAEQERAKEALITSLQKEGYVTYANILKNYAMRIFHQDAAKVQAGQQGMNIAYMKPDQGEVWVNGDIDMKYVSMLLRHEILHFYFDHQQRALEHLAKKIGIAEKDIEEYVKQHKEELQNKLYSSSTFNKSGDYEISNFGYTEEDKQLARNIVLYDIVVSALVTEDQHSSWTDLTMEELYDKLDRIDKLSQKYNLVYGRMKKGIFTDTQGNVFGPKDEEGNVILPKTKEENEEEDIEEALIYHTGKYISPTRFQKPDGSDYALVKTEYPSEATEGGSEDTSRSKFVDNPSKPSENNQPPQNPQNQKKQVVYHGSFINDTTFNDPNGNAY